MKTIIPIILSTMVTILSCNRSDHDRDTIQGYVPPLDRVSGVWVSADTADMEPSVRNFRGQALLNRDMASISWFASPPYSGGYHTGTLRVNGETPKISMFRWLPHQAIRKGGTGDWTLFSIVKMVPGEDAVLWDISIMNEADSARTLNLSLDLIGFISKYGGDWQWWYPYPKLDGKTTVRDDEVENVRKHLGSAENHSTEQVVELINGKPATSTRRARWPSDREILEAGKYTAEGNGGTLIIRDTETEAVTGFRILREPGRLDVKHSGGTASWEQDMEPGETFSLRYVMTWGDDSREVETGLDRWSGSFDSVSSSVERVWENRWQAMFRPGNKLFSGCFPVLETADEKAGRVYYTGPLTLLYLMNTNLPEHEKVFLTGGPRWGASITFFWDITEWATLWAVVDPAMMKKHLSSWILIDPSKYYGMDNFGGKGVGNGYSANYWALFQLVRSYVTVSRDFAFLQDTIAGKTVLEHLYSYAMNWKNLSLYGTPGHEDDAYRLADFGDDEWNLLECVPTYKHIVPSFNAGYAWMMREMAAIYDHEGRTAPADSLRNEAGRMIPRILSLYAGDGVWNSLYPDGSKVEVRHCLDFMFLGRYIPDDLPEHIKNEMIGFLYDELITDHWMRAQSLKDIAAGVSDRPDHGPLGAFDGWPAGTMDALVQMGYPDRALEFYHAIEPVTREGCWAQSHELWGRHKYRKDARVRIAQRGWGNRESSGGISISQVMLKCFFGFYPDVEGNPLRGNIPGSFSGKLHHVLYGDEYYTIVAHDGAVTMKKEK
jgi:hypothetical protein